MAATLDTVETYLTAAQTSFSSGDYQEARKQIILGQMELAKLPKSSSLDQATADTFRDSFRELRDAITDFEDEATATSKTRRVIARFV